MTHGGRDSSSVTERTDFDHRDVWPVAATTTTRSGLIAAFALAAAVGTEANASHSSASPTSSAGAPSPPIATPNVIFILTDDLDWKLMPYLPNIDRLLVDQGTTFDRYYVEQSTCCTSRSTILTGEYPHNHHVLSNFAPTVGYRKFHQRDEATALPTWLAADPSVTMRGLMGKFLNEYPFPYLYQPGPGQPSRRDLASYVPRGWNEWDVPADGQAYKQRHYMLNVNGSVQPRRNSSWTRSSANACCQSSMAISTVALTAPSPAVATSWSGRPTHPTCPTLTHAVSIEGIGRCATPGTRRTTRPTPPTSLAWPVSSPPLTAHQKRADNDAFRNRVRSLQVLDHFVGRLVRALQKSGSLEDTYLVFSSDNGYHMGEHRLPIGKYTQFETDVRVPLVVRGPGIAAGRTIHDLAGTST